MAVKNKIVIYIDGISYTPKLVIPVKIGELLDERLDECTISLRNVKVERFAPMTPVELVITNDVYWGEYDKDKVYHREEAVKYFLLADDAATESLLGKGFYDHDLALIEVTRAAELIVVDTITFTNDIGRNYAANAKPISPDTTENPAYS